MALLLTAVLFTGLGCATTGKVTKSDFAGHYAMVKGGFNEWLNVNLAQNGSYVLDHELFACVIGPNGEMPITNSREEGSWTFDGSIVVLEPRARTKDFPDTLVFAPALARRLKPKQEGASRLLVSTDYPERLVLKKTPKVSSMFGPEL